MNNTFNSVLCLLLTCGVFGSDEDKVKSVSVSVMVGKSVTLNTNLTQIQGINLIKWRFGDTVIAEFENNISTTNLTERFRDRLKLDHQTGSLTIKNINTTDSGLYHLQINGNNETQHVIFNATVLCLPTDHVAWTCVVVVLLLVAAAAAIGYFCYHHKICKLERINQMVMINCHCVKKSCMKTLQNQAIRFYKNMTLSHLKARSLKNQVKHVSIKADSQCTDRHRLTRTVTRLQFVTSQTFPDPTSNDSACSINENKLGQMPADTDKANTLILKNPPEYMLLSVSVVLIDLYSRLQQEKNVLYCVTVESS